MFGLKQAVPQAEIGTDDKPETTRAAALRLARRTSLAVHPDRVQAVAEQAERSWDDAVDWVLTQETTTERPPLKRPGADNDDWSVPVWWWIDQMSGPESGLTDRLAWFWHTLLTTNAENVSSIGLIADQLHDFRTLARTDFRTLLHAFVTSGALQEYLDGSWSVASNPNENLARELMELFTLGTTSGAADGLYTEDDVKAAARALAGWVVEDGRVEFRRANAFIAPLIFLGEQARWDTTMIVDRLCDHPATAAHVAGRMWLHLVGSPLGDEDRAELGQWWADHGLSIDPLLERIVASSALVESAGGRARSGLEWFCAARSALGIQADGINWGLWSIGQVPYQPPNVAGWQDYGGTNLYGQRWLSAGSLLSRSSVVWSLLDEAGMFAEDIADTFSDRFPHSTEEVLHRCGIVAATPQTWQALDAVARSELDLQTHTIGQVRWRLALSSPEFNLL